MWFVHLLNLAGFLFFTIACLASCVKLSRTSDEYKKNLTEAIRIATEDTTVARNLNNLIVVRHYSV